jgi:hypothetical protein
MVDGAHSDAVTGAAAALAEQALRWVQADDGSVRVEDYLTALAAVTGEAALADAGLFPLEGSGMTPGAAVFGDAVNVVLSGDERDAADAPPGSVVGTLVSELVPDVVSLDAFGPLERLYAHVAATVGEAPWGGVVTTVPVDNQPRVLPLRAAFELRAAVDSAEATGGMAAGGRHRVTALAVAAAIAQVRAAIDVQVALTLSLEVLFAMAKMVPMSQAALREAAGDHGEHP